MLVAYPSCVWAADLTVVVEGVRSRDGFLRVALFDSAKGFPMNAPLARALQSVKLASEPPSHPIILVFTNLAEGNYAVSVFHDEDSDGKLKTNILKIPAEGIGVSNNAKGHLGPPKFESAAFALNNQTKISITVLY